MSSCELCGNESNFLNDVRISGSVLKVCAKCKSLGKEMGQTETRAYTFKKRVKDAEPILEVVSDYPALISKALSKKGYTLHQLARGTNIKESTLNNYMKKTVKPDIDTANKIGKFLEIQLVYEAYEDENEVGSYIEEEPSTGLSLGELILQKMKK